ncbi:MAG: ethanolamine ammonia-lyase reactivating factor EutA, partial [Acidobacteria bacterium]|nr:ethanolamine ammonia-lyase reactivating factor EutA [Acidobacteriota bacterium]
MNTVQLVGLDFGTTTSSAVVAGAELLQNSVTGRMELGHVQERFRSPLIFTPWRDERIDVEAIEGAVAIWLQAGGVERGELFGGGALL